MNVSLAVFVRADIFYRVIGVARERDKIPFSKMLWSDPAQLLRLVDERFVSSATKISDAPDGVWRRFFVPEIKEIPVKDYLVSQILPRPRDLLFFLKAAITTAVNRKHSQVTADDILTAQRQYSQFAVDSVLVENGVSLKKLEDLIYEFAGSRVVQTRLEIADILKRVGIKKEEEDSIIEHLCNLTFLGRETENGVFRFAEDEQDARKIAVLARNVSEKGGHPSRFKINAAFCPFLEVQGNY